jgi:hypothetical protein
MIKCNDNFQQVELLQLCKSTILAGRCYVGDEAITVGREDGREDGTELANS